MSNLYDVTLSYNAFYYQNDVKIKGGLHLFHALTNRHRETEVVLQQIVVSFFVSNSFTCAPNGNAPLKTLHFFAKARTHEAQFPDKRTSQKTQE